MGDDVKQPVCDEQKQKFLAEANKANAEAQKARQETELLRLGAEHEAVRLKDAHIDLQRAEIKLAEDMASNKYHRIYHFTDDVNEESVKRCMNQLDIWHRTSEKGSDITVVFTSPGGSIIQGMALFDYLMGLRRDGHKLITVALGYAASMAGILLQAGESRVMGRESWLLIHEASFVALGKLSEVEDTVGWIKRIGKRVVDIFATRAAAALHGGEASKQEVARMKKFIEKNWSRKDWWLSSDDCKKHGFVDEVR